MLERPRTMTVSSRLVRDLCWCCQTFNRPAIKLERDASVEIIPSSRVDASIPGIVNNDTDPPINTVAYHNQLSFAPSTKKKQDNAYHQIGIGPIRNVLIYKSLPPLGDGICSAYRGDKKLVDLS